MADQFDYVAYAKDFEVKNGRPPTAEELTDAESLVGRYVDLDGERNRLDELVEMFNNLPKREMTRMERIRYRIGYFFGSIGSAIIKAILLLIRVPVYLTLFFFNLIKSVIAVFIMWFVSKLVIIMIISLIGDLTGKISGILKIIMDFIVGPKFLAGGNPDFFPHPVLDTWIIGLMIVFFALVLTFSKDTY